MAFFFYARLICLTAGTLVYLFILALILGHRRPRRLERLFFFLMLSLFLLYASGLLEINSLIQYIRPPQLTWLLHQGLSALGATLLLPMVLHTYFEYGLQVGLQARLRKIHFFLLGLAWLLPCMAAVFAGYASQVLTAEPRAFWIAEDYSTRMFVFLGAFLSACLALAFSRKVRKQTTDRRLFLWLFWLSTVCSVFAFFSWILSHVGEPSRIELVTPLLLTGVFPGIGIVYYALRHNFLDFGSQRNLVYALAATFLALLYFALVRRVSGWLEPVLPPEATAAILIFVLIFLFEPIERLIGPALHRGFRERFGRMQAVAVELREEARRGDVTKLIGFAERRVQEEFGLAAVRISVPRDERGKPLASPGGLGHVVRVPLLKEGKEIGLIEAASTGSYLTGETSAGLEFLAEQLPAMMDLCRLIGEKVRLERELAERERLALLGQMAASVSHNLRNPLSSMKTVLQVQLENPGLPFDVRHDCALVVDEIDRMSAKLTQLLRFAKPSVNGQRVAAVALAKQTAALFGRDAERRNVQLEFSAPSAEALVLASEEALSEALSNLIVNGIEAQPEGGRVRISLASAAGRIEIVVEDDGPGISKELRGRIFEPYFTTKATGTGLGLSIVARRVAEMGGTIACESPLREGKGTRFRLTLPLAEETGR